MMEKGITSNIIVLGRFLDSLRNCWLLTAVRKPDAVRKSDETFADVSRKRQVRLQNCYQYFVSDYEMK